MKYNCPDTQNKEFLVNFLGSAIPKISVVLLFLFTACNQSHYATLIAKKGIIQLPQELDARLFLLKGEFRFWPQLVAPNQTTTSNEMFTQSPGRFSTLPASAKVQEFASFQLLILDAKPNKVYSLLLPRIYSSYKLWVNDQPVYEMGRIAFNKSDAIAKVQTKDIQIQANAKGEIHIFLQVSNFHYRDGGFKSVWILSETKDAANHRLELMLEEALPFTALIIISFYHFILYGFRKEDTSILYFGIYSGILGIRSLVTSSELVLGVMPWAPYRLLMAMEYISFGLIMTMTMVYARSLYPKEFNKIMVQFYAYAGVLFSILVALTPPLFFTKTIIYCEILFVSMILYALYCVSLALKRRRLGIKTLFIVTIVLALTGINDILVSMAIYEGRLVAPAGMIVFMIGQATVLAKKLNLAETKDKAKSVFIADLSHEIRTPITTVITASQILQDENLTPNQLKYLQLIQKSSNHLYELLNNILDLGKIEAGKIELNESSFSIAELLDDIFEEYSLQTSSKDLQVSRQIDPLLPAYIVADRVRLKQIITNFFTNSVKYTTSGKIIIKADLLDTKNNIYKIQFCVADSGPGLNNQEIEVFFNQYQQFNTEKHNPVKGTGLGTNIAKRLIQLMHGSVYLRSPSKFLASSPFPGTDVVFELSLKGAHQKIRDEKDKTQTLAKIKNDTIHILLAEDNVDNQMLISTLLKKHMNCQISLATDGIETIEMALHNHYDLILMDINMPNLNGIEATKKLMAHSCKIPVIGLTASILAEVIQECLDAGMIHVMSKPFLVNDLKESIYKALAETKRNKHSND